MDDRYSRNILEIGVEGQERLKCSSVLICGLGGLGSGVLVSLAGFGVGKIGLIDFDVVSESNLNRQFIHKNIGALKTKSASRFLKEFNPKIEQAVQNCRVQEADFEGYDVIIDCLDNIESKFFLNRKACVPLVHGGVEGFFGQVMSIYNSACLDCFLELQPRTQTPSALSSVVNLISSIQATECLKIILGEKPLYNKLLRVNAKNWEFKISNMSKNPNCKYCSGH